MVGVHYCPSRCPFQFGFLIPILGFQIVPEPCRNLGDQFKPVGGFIGYDGLPSFDFTISPFAYRMM
jgi:hypothetical protein